MKTLRQVLEDNGFVKIKEENVDSIMTVVFRKGRCTYDTYAHKLGYLVSDGLCVVVHDTEINDIRVTIRALRLKNIECEMEEIPCKYIYHKGVDILENRTKEEMMIYLKLIS